MGMGLGWVPQTEPVPVPTKPIPRYPLGFPDPCYALTVRRHGWPIPPMLVSIIKSVVINAWVGLKGMREETEWARGNL